MEIALDKIIEWRKRPDIFVREVFKAIPDPKQDEVLRAFPHNPRIAMKASKGTGKTCTECWLAWNFLLTRPHPRVAATSVSGDTLSDTLWTEMAMWQQRSPLLSEAFTWTKTRIESKEHPKTWWMSARTWPKNGDKTQQANTLAGLHNDYIMFILDESGGIPEAVMASADAALSSCIEGHIVQGGNPTHLEGPLYRACTSDKKLWYIVEMTGDPDDPGRSPRVSIEWARSQVEQWGKDNPWVLVNVYGKFPPSSLNALIGPEEIREAFKRSYKLNEFKNQPRILGVDVARFGDDSSIIFPRQGLQAFDPLVYRNIDGTEGAEYTQRKWNEWDADACFIDNSGGFGSSWVDNLIRLGKDPIPIAFNSKASSEKYFNKRTEMAFELVEWIKRGGALPEIPELQRALTQTTYSFKGEKLLLEPKEDVKLKLGYSPDHMDALMLTFAAPIDKRRDDSLSANKNYHVVEYDPFSRDKLFPQSDRY
jgi:hypothetical protein